MKSTEMIGTWKHSSGHRGRHTVARFRAISAALLKCADREQEMQVARGISRQRDHRTR